MTSTSLSPTSPSAGHKRQRDVSHDDNHNGDGDSKSNQQLFHLHIVSPPASSAITSAPISAFRNVSACNRCRLRKNRCDQRLPACSSCEKAHVKCVGYDPITKREIPRRLVGPCFLLPRFPTCTTSMNAG
jgi:hypothetical protein